VKINVLETDEQIITSMYNQISNVITENKTKMIYQINNTLVETNFMIGKIIIENEQNGNIRAEYGKDILKKLSKKLTNELVQDLVYLGYIIWDYFTIDINLQ